MVERPAADAAKLKVFISYSRSDSEFADRLLGGLEARGFDAYLDKHDIAPGEPWRERLGKLIQSADTVIYVISPDSVRSEICAWEVAETERLSKRILPVVCRPVDGEAAPPALARLNYVFFTPGCDEEAEFARLSEALETDLVWIREHSRLGELACRWDERGRRAGVLNAHDLTEAESWLARQPNSAPPPTDLHRLYVKSSRDAATRRQRGWIGGSLAIAAVTSTLGLFASYQKHEATEQRDLARLSQKQVEEERNNADRRRREAEANEARSLGARARGLIRKHETSHALALIVLALEKVHSQPDPLLRGELVALASAALVDNRLDAVLRGHAAAVYGGLFHPDGRRLFTFGADGTIRAWDVATGAPLAVLSAEEREPEELIPRTTWHFQGTPLYDLRSIGDGSVLLAAGGDGVLSVWSAEGRLFGRFPWDWDASINSAEVSPDGRWVVVGGTGGAIGVFDVKRRTWVPPAGAPLAAGDDVLSIAVLSGPARAVMAGPDGTVRIISLPDQTLLRTLAGHQGRVTTVRYSRALDRIVTMSFDGTVGVWDPRDGRRLRTLRGHGGRLYFGDLSPDGTVAASVSEDHTARLWRIDTGELVAVLPGHTDTVYFAAFSPQGDQVATASDDGTLRLWRTADGAALEVLSGHDDRVYSAAFSADGRRLLSNSFDATARLWEVPAVPKKVAPGERDEEESSIVGLRGDRVFWMSTEAVVASTLGGREVFRTPQPGDKPERASVALSPSGHRLALWVSGGAAQLYDVDTGRSTSIPGVATEAISFSGEDHLLVDGEKGLVLLAVAEDLRLTERRRWGDSEAEAHPLEGSGELVVATAGSIEVLDLAAPDRATLTLTPGGSLAAVARTRRGRMLAIARDDTLSVYRDEEQIYKEAADHYGYYGIPTVVISPSGDLLAHVSAFKESQVHLVDLGNRPAAIAAAPGPGASVLAASDATADAIVEPEAQSLVHSVAISPDETRLAIVGGLPADMGGAAHVALYDLETRAEVARIRYQERDVSSIWFSPKRPVLLVLTKQGVTFWDTASGEQLHTAYDTAALGSCCEPAADGETVVGLSPDGHLRRLRLPAPPEDFLTLAKAFALEPMSCVAPPRGEYEFFWKGVEGLRGTRSTECLPWRDPVFSGLAGVRHDDTPTSRCRALVAPGRPANRALLAVAEYVAAVCSEAVGAEPGVTDLKARLDQAREDVDRRKHTLRVDETQAGDPVVKIREVKDLADARKLAEESFARGRTDVAGELAWRLVSGGAAEVAEALAWYRRLIDRGDPVGHYGLAWMMERGLGMERDLPGALRAYAESARLFRARDDRPAALIADERRYALARSLPEADLLRVLRRAAAPAGNRDRAVAK